MREFRIPFGGKEVQVRLPEGTDVLRMKEPEPVADPAAAVREALEHPAGTKPLLTLAREKRAAALAAGREAKACIVVSDNTRPVPYKGEQGILLPLLRALIGAGFEPGRILVLVATGTHRPMSGPELVAMLGEEPFSMGIEVLNHDCHDESNLVHAGTTARGTVARINRRYVEADLKILTGLVESHFMAGASGGRKAICPGIFGEEGTFIFHSAALMAHPQARDLVIEGNPVHEESLAVARMAGADFIANVTVDGSFRITGVFFGELAQAHAAAVAKLKSYVAIPVGKPYDLVVTHGGFVAVNHYQAAKAAVASLGALKSGGALVLAADHRDPNPVGSDRYRTVLSLLKLVGPEALERILASPDWAFIPEQWQVQMWAKVFRKISMKDFYYFAPQLDGRHWRDLPGFDASVFTAPGSAAAGADADGDCSEALKAAVGGSVADILARRGFTEADVASGRFRVAFMADGPYGIPLQS